MVFPTVAPGLHPGIVRIVIMSQVTSSILIAFLDLFVLNDDNSLCLYVGK